MADDTHRGGVQMCAYCEMFTTEPVTIRIHEGGSGPGGATYACPACVDSGNVAISPEVVRPPGPAVVVDDGQVPGVELERDRWGRYLEHVSGCSKCLGKVSCVRERSLHAAWQAAKTTARE
jgi:hypothetical protein